MQLLRKFFRGRHLGISALLLLGISIVAVIFPRFDIRAHILSVLDWLEGQGIWAPVFFILIDAAFVVLLLPGLLMTLGAGFMFGVVRGGLWVIIGTTLGATIAFLIAQQLKGSKYSQYFLRDQRLQLLVGALAQRGWGTVMLTRLVPFFPFKLSNYFFGLTGYTLIDFIIGTFLGIMPITFCNAYVGSLAADLAALGTPRTARSPAEWTLYGLGLVIFLAIVIIGTHVAQKTFSATIRENIESPPRVLQGINNHAKPNNTALSDS